MIFLPRDLSQHIFLIWKGSNAGFVNFRFFRFAASPKRIIRTAPAKPPEVPLIEAMAGLQMPVGTQCFLWRKSLLDRVPEKWRPGLFFGEDQEYYFRLLHEARGGIALDEPILFFYRRNRNGLCYRLRHDRRILDDSYIVYKSKVETALRYGDGNAVQEALSKRLRKQMRLAFRFGDLEYLARFLQLAELLTVSDKEKEGSVDDGIPFASAGIASVPPRGLTTFFPKVPENDRFPDARLWPRSSPLFTAAAFSGDEGVLSTLNTKDDGYREYGITIKAPDNEYVYNIPVAGPTLTTSFGSTPGSIRRFCYGGTDKKGTTLHVVLSHAQEPSRRRFFSIRESAH